MEQPHSIQRKEALLDKKPPEIIRDVAHSICKALQDELGVDFITNERGSVIVIRITDEIELSGEAFAILATDNATAGVGISYDVDTQQMEIAPRTS